MKTDIKIQNRLLALAPQGTRWLGRAPFPRGPRLYSPDDFWVGNKNSPPIVQGLLRIRRIVGGELWTDHSVGNDPGFYYAVVPGTPAWTKFCTDSDEGTLVDIDL